MNPIYIFITVFFSGGVDAKENSFENASQNFAKGLELRQDALSARPLFNKAAANLQILSQSGEPLIKVFRMWAAAEILQEKFPEARMACLLGLKKYPADPVLTRLSNYTDANLSTHGWRPPMALFSSRLAIYFAGIIQLAAIGFLWLKNKRLAVGLLIIAWSTALVHLISTRNGSSAPFAIVRQECQPRVGNGGAFPPEGKPILSGAILFLNRIQPGWAQITLPGGKTAWIQSDQLLFSTVSSSNSIPR